MDEIQIRFSGSGGQGLLLSARILATALSSGGRHVAQSQSYEPVSRGGLSRADLVIAADQPLFPLASRLDYLLILHDDAARASDDLIGGNTRVLADADLVSSRPGGGGHVLELPFTAVARRLGNQRAANVVALGALAALGGLCSDSDLDAAIARHVPARLGDLNIAAAAEGRKLVAQTEAAALA